MTAKVLIAHGNTQRLKQAVNELYSAGLDVVATPDGGDAFARFFEELPEIVIVSAALPSLPGVNIARMVRSQSPATHVIVLSEGPLEQPIDNVIVLPDPLNMEDLRRALPTVNLKLPHKAAEAAVVVPANTPVRVFVHAVLKRFQRDNQLLGLLDERGINRMTDMAEHRSYAGDEVIIKQGDEGDGFYLLVEGQVRVTLAEKGDREVARISAGGFFGEMSLLSDQKRSASVLAAGPATVLWFERQGFLPLLDDYPKMREVLSGVALRRTEDNLWRVLFDDEEVQRSIAQLDDSLPVLDSQPPVLVPLPVTPLPAPARTSAPSPWLQWHVAIGVFLGLAIGVFAGRLWSGPAQTNATPAKPTIAPTAQPALATSQPSPGTPVSTQATIQAEEAQPSSLPVAASQPSSSPVTPRHVSSPVGGDEDERPEEAEKKKVTESPPLAKVEPKAVAKDETREAGETEPSEDATQSRRELLQAAKSGHAKQVLLLAKQFPTPDAEVAFAIAEAERAAGVPSDALTAYLKFVSRFPNDGRADDAQFWAAELYRAQGKTAEAQELYRAVANNPTSNFRTSANKRLH